MVSKSSCLARLFTLGFTLIAIVLLVFGSIYWSRVQAFNRTIDELESRGVPTKWADLIPEENLADEDNAIWILESEKEKFAQLVTRNYEIIKDLRFDEPLTENQVVQLEASFAKNPELFDLLDRAMDAPASQPLIDYTNPETLNFVTLLQTQHNITRTLALKIRTLLFRDNTDQALKWALTGWKLADLMNEYPTFVSNMANTSRRLVMLSSLANVMKATKLSAKDSQLIEQILSDADELSFFDFPLITERVLFLENKKVSPLFGNHFLKVFEQELEFGTRSYFETDTENRALFKPPSDTIFKFVNGETSAFHHLPGLYQLRRSISMIRGEMRSIRVLNALQQMNANGKNTIRDVKLPENAKIDPFNGEPLIIKFTDDGWQVYSVGQNLKDDGGVLGLDSGAGLVSEE